MIPLLGDYGKSYEDYELYLKRKIKRKKRTELLEDITMVGISSVAVVFGALASEIFIEGQQHAHELPKFNEYYNIAIDAVVGMATGTLALMPIAFFFNRWGISNDGSAGPVLKDSEFLEDVLQRHRKYHISAKEYYERQERLESYKR